MCKIWRRPFWYNRVDSKMKFQLNYDWITTENMLVKWARALNPSAICISGNIRSCFRGTGVYTMCTVPSPHVANLRPKLHAASILLRALYFHTLMVTDYISCLIKLFHAPQTGCSRDLHQRKSVTLRMIWSYWIWRWWWWIHILLVMDLLIFSMK